MNRFKSGILFVYSFDKHKQNIMSKKSKPRPLLAKIALSDKQLVKPAFQPNEGKYSSYS